METSINLLSRVHANIAYSPQSVPHVMEDESPINDWSTTWIQTTCTFCVLCSFVPSVCSWLQRGRPLSMLAVWIKFLHVYNCICWSVLHFKLCYFWIILTSGCQICDLKLRVLWITEDSYLTIWPWPLSSDYDLSNVPKVFHHNSFVVPQSHYNDLAPGLFLSVSSVVLLFGHFYVVCAYWLIFFLNEKLFMFIFLSP